jgi:hypothetical protein
MHLSRTTPVFFLSLFCVFLLQGCGGRTEFQDFSSLKEEAEKDGYLLMGKFGDQWPATLQDTREMDDRIDFQVPGRGPQSYPGYKGYHFRLYILLSESGKKFVVLFKKKKIVAEKGLDQFIRWRPWG